MSCLTATLWLPAGQPIRGRGPYNISIHSRCMCKLGSPAVNTYSHCCNLTGQVLSQVVENSEYFEWCDQQFIRGNADIHTSLVTFPEQNSLRRNRIKDDIWKQKNKLEQKHEWVIKAYRTGKGLVSTTQLSSDEYKIHPADHAPNRSDKVNSLCADTQVRNVREDWRTEKLLMRKLGAMDESHSASRCCLGTGFIA